MSNTYIICKRCGAKLCLPANRGLLEVACVQGLRRNRSRDSPSVLAQMDVGVQWYFLQKGGFYYETKEKKAVGSVYFKHDYGDFGSVYFRNACDKSTGSTKQNRKL